MKKYLFLLILMTVAPEAMAQTPVLRVGRLNNQRHCTYEGFSGSTAGAKIANCLANLPASGGRAYAHFEGNQTISQDVFSGITECLTLEFGGGNFIVSATQNLKSCQKIKGAGTNDRWRAASQVTTLSAHSTLTTALIRLAPGAGNGIDSVYIEDMVIDGTNVSGSVDGIRLDADASGAYIEGFRMNNVTVQNFPRIQVLGIGTVFDVIFTGSTFQDRDRDATGNLVHYQYLGTAGTAPGSQWTFNNCWFAIHSTGNWAFFAGLTGSLTSNVISDVRFEGGTIAGYDNTDSTSNGANGIWVNGGLTVIGTHLENVPYNQPRSIGIRYTGFNGAYIVPSQVSFWGTGVEIGNSGNEINGTARLSDGAQGAQIMGTIGFNNSCVTPIVCSDVHITATGTRKGTYVNLGGSYTQSGNFGQSDGLPEVLNNATVKDDVYFHEWTASVAGRTRIGPLNYDMDNSRIGINVDPTLTLHVRTGTSNGLRIDNSGNSNRILAQILNVSDQGQFVAYDSSEALKVQFDANTNGGVGYLEPYIHSQLPALSDGSFLICSDCAPASNPCSGSSTGTIALRIGGAWVCR